VTNFRGDLSMNLKTLVLVSVMALSTTSVVRAELVDQIPAGTFVPATYSGSHNSLSQYDANGPSELPDPYLANFATAFDNFKFTINGTVDNLSWIGQYEADSVNPPRNPGFRVSFYTSLGSVGAPVLANSFDVLTANEVGTGVFGTVNNFTQFYSYSATVPSETPFNVVADTEYFVSIVALMSYNVTGAGWGLAFSETNGDSKSYQDFESTPLSLERFENFTLSDGVDYAINISAVPEPGSLSAVLAVVGFVVVRHRRLVKKLS
jgi:hypothetical protein